MQGASQTLQDAFYSYQDTVNQIYSDAEANGTNPDQSALDAAQATLYAAQHDYANSEASANVTLTAALGVDNVDFVNDEEDAYIGEQNAVASAVAAFLQAQAPALQTLDDAVADLTQAYDGDVADIQATYQDDMADQFKIFNNKVAEYEKTREDAIADADNTLGQAEAAAWKTEVASVAAAMLQQANDDAAAAELRNNALASIEETLDNQIAGAGQIFEHAEAVANADYANNVAAAVALDETSKAQYQADHDNEEAGEYQQLLDQAAEAEATSIVNAAGGDPTTASVAQAWTNYYETMVQQYVGYVSQVTAAWTATVSSDVAAYQQDVSQDAIEDTTLDDAVAGAKVTQIAQDASAGTTYVSTVSAAMVTEVAKDATAAQTDQNKEASNFLQLVQTVGPALVTQEEADTTAEVKFAKANADKWDSEFHTVETQASNNIKQVDAAMDTAIHGVDAAGESEVSQLIGPAETQVDDDAHAHKTYMLAQANQQATDANNAAIDNQTTVQNEPDSDFANVYPGPSGGPSSETTSDATGTSFWDLYCYYLSPMNNSNVDGWDTALAAGKWIGWGMAAVGTIGATVGTATVGVAAAFPTFLGWGATTVSYAAAGWNAIGSAYSYVNAAYGVQIYQWGMWPPTWGTVWAGTGLIMSEGEIGIDGAMRMFVEGATANPDFFNWASGIPGGIKAKTPNWVWSKGQDYGDGEAPLPYDPDPAADWFGFQNPPPKPPKPRPAEGDFLIGPGDVDGDASTVTPFQIRPPVDESGFGSDSGSQIVPPDSSPFE